MTDSRLFEAYHKLLKTQEDMRIAIWLIGEVSAAWVCGTIEAPQGKRLSRVLGQVGSEKLMVSGGLCVERWLGRVLVTDYLGYAAS